MVENLATEMASVEVVVDAMSNSPTDFWNLEKEKRTVMRLKVRTPKEPKKNDKIRVVCLSDTHSLTSHMKRPIPTGDIFIHAGDFTRCGNMKEVREFNTWLATLPHPHKIVVAGNHELSFDPSFRRAREVGSGEEFDSSVPRSFPPSPRSSHIGRGRGGGDLPMILSKIDRIPTLGVDRGELKEAVDYRDDPRMELTNCTYLEDSATSVLGLNVYGTPWQPEYCGWAFNLPRGTECLKKWNEIPVGTDILVTHTPPAGYGDRCATGVRAGCVELLNTVQKRVKPKYHIYGHIHEGYGVRSDGKTVFINASSCDINYMPNNKPIVFDIPFPQGYSR